MEESRLRKMNKGGNKTLLHFFSRKQEAKEESSESQNSSSVSEASSVASISTNIDEHDCSSSSFCGSKIQVNKPAEVLQYLNLSPSQSNLHRRDPLCGKDAALEYFKEGPFQPSVAQFPETKGRRFRSAWYSQFKWLEYSVSGDKAFCFPCRLFGSIGNYDETFITNGFKNWKKATQRFQEHEHSSSHLSALQRWQEGLKCKASVAEKISSHHKDEVEKNREYLKILFETLLFLGRQGLALRGHREEESSDNRGNFIELLKLRSSDNSLLKKMFLEREKYFNYVHHDVQNEMLEILASQIKTDILENVKKCKYFSVIVDETPDVANQEQLTIVLRYVTADLKIKERFLGFYKTDFTDGESLYRLLLFVLNEVGLDPSNIVAQCYDGAANMSGVHKGVAVRFKENNKHIMYVHCYMHSLNLALVDSSKSISMVRNVFSTVQQLYCFIEASPKRHAIFLKIKKSAVGESNTTEFGTNLSLKALSDTRFSNRYESVRAVQQHLTEIIQTLEEIEANDLKAGGEAHGLILCMKRMEFVFGLNMMKQVFEKTNILSEYIQNYDVSVHEVVDVAKRIVTAIADLRSENKFDMIWSEAKIFCEKHGFAEPVIPRKRKVPQKIGGGDIHPAVSSPRDLCLKTAYYPFLDNIIENIKLRFDKNQLTLLCHMETVLTASFKRDSISNEMFKEACSDIEEAYEIKCDSLCAEIDVFSRKETFKADCTSISRLVLEFKSQNSYNQVVYPNIVKLLKLYLTVPVSTASAERSFSVLKRIKNYLRNTTQQTRLTHLAILAIEKSQINLDECVEVYSRKKQRHLSLF